MIKRLLTLICFLSITAYGGMIVRGPVARPAGCTTAGFTQGTTANNGSASVCNNSNKYVGQQFTADGTYTACKVDVNLQKVGTPSVNLDVSIYTDNAGVPGTLIGTASDVIASSTISTSPTTYTFVNMSASLTSGTLYWIVLHASAGVDNSNYIIFVGTGGSSPNTSPYASINGTSWSTLGSSGDALIFTLYH